jgi:hypothetical protein
MKNAHQRVTKVFKELSDISEANTQDSIDICDALEEMLNNMNDNNFFGSERQNDPRGDGRKGEFCMSYIDGIDT